MAAIIVSSLLVGVVAATTPPYYAPCPVHPAAVASVDLASLRSAIDSTFSKLANATTSGSVPGVAMAVSYRNQVIWKGAHGFADKARAEAIDPERTIFRVGSNTKVLVALCASILASKGVLDINAPVKDTVPEWTAINRFNDDEIRWRDIASQQAGLWNNMDPSITSTPGGLASMKQLWLVNPPGGAPSYSNFGFAILGHLLAERVWQPSSGTLSLDAAGASNEAFAQMVQQLISDPLRLNRTGVNFTDAVRARMATGYLPDGSPLSDLTDLGWFAPAGGMFSTVTDLATVTGAVAAAQRGEATALDLSPQLARDFLRVHVVNNDGATMFGAVAPWEARHQQSYLVLRKGGNLGAWTALMLLIPELDLTAQVSWNGGGNEFLPAYPLAQGLVAAFNSSLTAAAAPPDPGTEPSRYVGAYNNSNDGSTIHVELKQTPKGQSFLSCRVMVEPGGIVVAEYALALVQGDRFVTVPPQLDGSCLRQEIEALANNYVIFERDGGAVKSLTMPGYETGTWVKAAQ